MTPQTTVYRRIVRRETHSSRAGAAITVSVILLLALIAAAIGCGYLIAHLPAAAGIAAFARDLAPLESTVRSLVVVAGIVALVLGVIAIVLAVAPGRKARRALTAGRVAAVVDDGVVARALAMQAARAAGVERRQAKVVVSRRRATVWITPTAGVGVDDAAVRDAVRRVGEAAGLDRDPRVSILERAVVG